MRQRFEPRGEALVDADKCSRMRVGYVRSVIEAFQPSGARAASISGRRTGRALKTLPFLRLTAPWKPPAAHGHATLIRVARHDFASDSSHYGKGGVWPTSSFSLQPVIAQNAALT